MKEKLRNMKKGGLATVVSLAASFCAFCSESAIDPPLTFDSVHYGPHARQVMDVWLPEGAKVPTPIVIGIHGGGFEGGDRRHDGALRKVRECLAEGVAAVSVDYRLLKDAGEVKPPVRMCFEDVVAAMRFIVCKAKEWNVDVSRMGLEGGSAGACAALYVALADGNPFGVKAVLANHPQTTLDPVLTREWIPNARYGHRLFGFSDFQTWHDHAEEVREWARRYSAMDLVRACPMEKAPLLLYGMQPLPPEGQLPRDPTHAGIFAVKFAELSNSLGIDCRRGTHRDLLFALKRPRYRRSGGEALAGEEIRHAEIAAFEHIADLAVALPPELRTAGIEAYSTNNLDFAMNNGLAAMSDGTLWSSWIAGEDGPEAFTVASFSKDFGETWSDVALVIDGHGRVPTRGNPCGRANYIGTFWLGPDGRLRLYTNQSLIHFDGRAGVWESVCEDGQGFKWTKPRRISDGHAINKPIVLSNGHLALATYLNKTFLHRKRFCMPGAFASLDARRGTTCFISEDGGATWEARGTVNTPGTDWDESQFVELRDGTLRVFLRSNEGEVGALLFADSRDEGRTWTAPKRHPSMDNPNARFQIARLKSGRLLFVKHGAPSSGGKDGQGRDRLTAYLSDDDGETWRGGLLLFEGTCSYPDACQTPDGAIFVSHDHDRAGVAEILIHRFAEEDVLAGKIVSPKSRLSMLVSRGMANQTKTP